MTKQETPNNEAGKKLQVFDVLVWDFVKNTGEVVYSTNDYNDAKQHAYIEALQYTEDEKPRLTTINGITVYVTNCDFGTVIHMSKVKKEADEILDEDHPCPVCGGTIGHKINCPKGRCFTKDGVIGGTAVDRPINNEAIECPRCSNNLTVLKNPVESKQTAIQYHLDKEEAERQKHIPIEPKKSFWNKW